MSKIIKNNNSGEGCKGVYESVMPENIKLYKAENIESNI